jgi:hypothetical protein
MRAAAESTDNSTRRVGDRGRVVNHTPATNN